MKTLYFVLILSLSLSGFSQEYKIPKITPQDFDLEKENKNSNSNAIIEYNIGSTYFEPAGDNYQVVTITKTRIKILNKDGYDYATVKVPLYQDKSAKEYLTVTNAYTYNLENGVVDRVKLKSDGEFREHVEGNHYLATFTMPNVKEGSILEYTTKVISPFYTSVPEWYFQFDVPVKYSEFSIKLPDFLIFNKTINGSIKVNQLNVGEELMYKAYNIPALKNESFVSNINNYRSSIIHTFSGYKTANGVGNMFADTWSTLTKFLYKTDNFGKQLANVEDFKEYALPLVEGLTTDEEKADAIYKYVQKNFNCTQKIGLYASQKIKDTFSKKSGTSADLNLLTIALMKSVDIKAYPIILSTRSNGITYVPSIKAFNNLIIGVENLKTTSYYDVSSKFASKNVLPIYNINLLARIIYDNSNSKSVILVPKFKSRYGISGTLNIELGENTITGKFRRSYSNYEAMIVRTNYENLSTDKMSEKVEESYNAEVKNYQVNNLNDLSENVEESFELLNRSSYDLIGDKIYLNPLHIFGMDENPFKQEERDFPIDFIYPKTSAYTLTYNIPEGYEVEFLPEAKKYITGSRSLEVGWLVVQDKSQIKIRFNLDYNVAIVNSKEYTDIKKIFEEVVKFSNEKIVLKKVA